MGTKKTIGTEEDDRDREKTIGTGKKNETVGLHGSFPGVREKTIGTGEKRKRENEAVRSRGFFPGVRGMGWKFASCQRPPIGRDFWRRDFGQTAG